MVGIDLPATRVDAALLESRGVVGSVRSPLLREPVHVPFARPTATVWPFCRTLALIINVSPAVHVIEPVIGPMSCDSQSIAHEKPSLVAALTARTPARA